LLLGSIALLIVLLVWPRTRRIATTLLAVAALGLVVLGAWGQYRRTHLPRQPVPQRTTGSSRFWFNITYQRNGGDGDAAARVETVKPADAAAPPDEDLAVAVDESERLPDWVESSPDYTGEVHTIPVTVGPFKTRGECESAQRDAIAGALEDYLDWYLPHDLGAGRVAFRPSIEDVQQVPRQETVIESLEHPVFGGMLRAHVLLAIDGDYRDYLERRARESVLASRLQTTAAVTAAVLLLLTALFGFLKLNQAGRPLGATQRAAV
jgi:hypothetical protein